MSNSSPNAFLQPSNRSHAGSTRNNSIFNISDRPINELSPTNLGSPASSSPNLFKQSSTSWNMFALSKDKKPQNPLFPGPNERIQETNSPQQRSQSQIQSSHSSVNIYRDADDERRQGSSSTISNPFTSSDNTKLAPNPGNNFFFGTRPSEFALNPPNSTPTAENQPVLKESNQQNKEEEEPPSLKFRKSSSKKTLMGDKRQSQTENKSNSIRAGSGSSLSSFTSAQQKKSNPSSSNSVSQNVPSSNHANQSDGHIDSSLVPNDSQTNTPSPSPLFNLASNPSIAQAVKSPMFGRPKFNIKAQLFGREKSKQKESQLPLSVPVNQSHQMSSPKIETEPRIKENEQQNAVLTNNIFFSVIQPTSTQINAQKINLPSISESNICKKENLIDPVIKRQHQHSDQQQTDGIESNREAQIQRIVSPPDRGNETNSVSENDIYETPKKGDYQPNQEYKQRPAGLSTIREHSYEDSIGRNAHDKTLEIQDPEEELNPFKKILQNDAKDGNRIMDSKSASSGLSYFDNCSSSNENDANSLSSPSRQNRLINSKTLSNASQTKKSDIFARSEFSSKIQVFSQTQQLSNLVPIDVPILIESILLDERKPPKSTHQAIETNQHRKPLNPKSNFLGRAKIDNFNQGQKRNLTSQFDAIIIKRTESEDEDDSHSFRSADIAASKKQEIQQKSPNSPILQSNNNYIPKGSQETKNFQLTASHTAQNKKLVDSSIHEPEVRMPQQKPAAVHNQFIQIEEQIIPVTVKKEEFITSRNPTTTKKQLNQSSNLELKVSLQYSKSVNANSQNSQAMIDSCSILKITNLNLQNQQSPKKQQKTQPSASDQATQQKNKSSFNLKPHLFPANQLFQKETKLSRQKSRSPEPNDPQTSFGQRIRDQARQQKNQINEPSSRKSSSDRQQVCPPRTIQRTMTFGKETPLIRANLASQSKNNPSLSEKIQQTTAQNKELPQLQPRIQNLVQNSSNLPVPKKQSCQSIANRLFPKKISPSTNSGVLQKQQTTILKKQQSPKKIEAFSPKRQQETSQETQQNPNPKLVNVPQQSRPNVFLRSQTQKPLTDAQQQQPIQLPPQTKPSLFSFEKNISNTKGLIQKPDQRNQAPQPSSTPMPGLFEGMKRIPVKTETENKLVPSAVLKNESKPSNTNQIQSGNASIEPFTEQFRDHQIKVSKQELFKTINQLKKNHASYDEENERVKMQKRQKLDELQHMVSKIDSYEGWMSLNSYVWTRFGLLSKSFIEQSHQFNQQKSEDQQIQTIQKKHTQTKSYLRNLDSKYTILQGTCKKVKSITDRYDQQMKEEQQKLDKKNSTSIFSLLKLAPNKYSIQNAVDDKKLSKKPYREAEKFIPQQCLYQLQLSLSELIKDQSLQCENLSQKVERILTQTPVKQISYQPLNTGIKIYPSKVNIRPAMTVSELKIDDEPSRSKLDKRFKSINEQHQSQEKASEIPYCYQKYFNSILRSLDAAQHQLSNQKYYQKSKRALQTPNFYIQMRHRLQSLLYDSSTRNSLQHQPRPIVMPLIPCKPQPHAIQLQDQRLIDKLQVEHDSYIKTYQNLAIKLKNMNFRPTLTTFKLDPFDQYKKVTQPHR